MKRKIKLFALFALTGLFSLSVSCKDDDSSTVEVSQITLHPTSLTLGEGETFTVTATVIPADATDKRVKWTTSDVAVAVVDSAGKVIGKKAGTATVTATTEDGNKTAACAVTVTKHAAEDNFVLIPAGTFIMGSPAMEPNRSTDEIQHKVTISKDFYMAKYPVTFAEYDAFCEATNRTKPSDNGWGRGNRPAINVSWDDAVAYAAWLSGKSGKTYRLPTEAEWEYACRAGTTTTFNTGNCLTNEQANYDWYYPYDNCTNTVTTAPYKTIPVGTYPANAWGLYDMHGNVFEWCSDWYKEDFPRGSETDPQGAENGSLRVIRGGNWYNYAEDCRSASRNCSNPEIKDVSIGIRLVCEK